jgi:hypothetical protein
MQTDRPDNVYWNILNTKTLLQNKNDRDCCPKIYFNPCLLFFLRLYIPREWMDGGRGLMDTFENKNKIKIRARELSLPVGFVHEQKTGCWLLDLGESSVSAGAGGKKQGG